MRIPVKNIQNNTIFNKFEGIKPNFEVKNYIFYSELYELKLKIIKYDTFCDVHCGGYFKTCRNNKELLEFLKEF